MNNKLARLGKKLDKARIQLSASAMALYYAICSQILPAMAAWQNVTVNVQEDVNASDMLGTAISMVLFVISGFGIGVLIVGFVDVAQSFMSDQPEKRTRGFGLIIAGAIMVGMSSVLQMAGLVST